MWKLCGTLQRLVILPLESELHSTCICNIPAPKTSPITHAVVFSDKLNNWSTRGPCMYETLIMYLTWFEAAFAICTL